MSGHSAGKSVRSYSTRKKNLSDTSLPPNIYKTALPQKQRKNFSMPCPRQCTLACQMTEAYCQMNEGKPSLSSPVSTLTLLLFFCCLYFKQTDEESIPVAIRKVNLSLCLSPIGHEGKLIMNCFENQFRIYRINFMLSNIKRRREQYISHHFGLSSDCGYEHAIYKVSQQYTNEHIRYFHLLNSVIDWVVFILYLVNSFNSGKVILPTTSSKIYAFNGGLIEFPKWSAFKKIDAAVTLYTHEKVFCQY